MGLFRAYSIRGVYGKDLTDAAATRIGAAFGTYLHKRGIFRVAAGYDVRLSSPAIFEAAVGGLLSTGCEVVDLGMVPTPQMNFATDFTDAEAGLMVTASHNPPEDNGFKLRTDHTLMGGELAEVERYFEAGVTGDGCGVRVPIDTQNSYLAALKARVAIRRPVRLVIDAGNGTIGPLAVRLFQELGCQVTCLYCEPDGSFPNHHPNPVNAANLNDLVQAVRSSQGAYELGLAYDGDGDRVAVVDETGRILSADYLMILLVRQAFARHGAGKVVVDAMSSRALTDEVARLGGVAVRAPVGYALVHERMRSEGALLGGEMAGHIFFRDPLFRFDDSLLASIRLLEILSASDLRLSELFRDIPRYLTNPEARLDVPDERKFIVIDQMKGELEAKYPIDTTDGVRIDFDDGWAIVRASQTQPAIVYRVEAADKRALERIITIIRQALEKHL